MKENYAKYIWNLVDNSEDFKRDNEHSSFVLAIDGEWGCGKTTFIKNYLMEKEDVSIIYYDAWEHDCWDNAFEPFISSIMKSSIFKYIETEEKFWEKFSTSAAVMLKYLSCGIVKKFTGVNIKDGISELENKLKEKNPDALRSAYSDYDIFYENIQTFKYYLKKIYEKNNQKIIIIIDELDRCRPAFASSTLEFVKHIFDCEGYCFIFSSDLQQLSNSMKSVYGDMDTRAYLNRFFDHISFFPTIMDEKFIYEELNNIKFLNNRSIELISYYFEKYRITNIRDFLMFKAAILVLKDELSLYGSSNGQEILLTLLFGKVFYPKDYFNFINGRVEISKSNDFFRALSGDYYDKTINKCCSDIYFYINIKYDLYKYLCGDIVQNNDVKFDRIKYNEESNEVWFMNSTQMVTKPVDEVLDEFFFLTEKDIINPESLENISMDCFFKNKLELANFAFSDYPYKERVNILSLEIENNINEEKSITTTYKCKCGKGLVEKFINREPGNRYKDIICDCKECNSKYYFY